MRWRTWIFDCDGVLLDSNRLKSEAFYTAAKPYGEAAARALEAYNKTHGGITRQAKFRHLFESILGQRDCETEIRKALDRFADIVARSLAACPEAPGLRDLLARIAAEGGRCLVVSGGAENEVRAALRARGLAEFFVGIYGNPDDKDAILARESAAGSVRAPAVFIGDSAYDHAAARRAGLDFIFASYWTEFADWRRYCADNNLITASSLSDIERFLSTRAGR